MHGNGETKEKILIFEELGMAEASFQRGSE
jgi:hypothetical protein